MKSQLKQKNILRSSAFSVLFVALVLLGAAAPVQADSWNDNSWRDREERHQQALRHERERLKMRSEIYREHERNVMDDRESRAAQRRALEHAIEMAKHEIRSGIRHYPILLPPPQAYIIPGFN